MARSSSSLVIVGAGPAGLAAALVFASQNRDVILLDPHPLPTELSPTWDLRVSALRHSSIRFLDELGVWPTIQALRATPIASMCVWEKSADLHLPAALFNAEDVGYIVENSVIKFALAQKLRTEPKIQFIQSAVKSLRELDQRLSLLLENGQRLETPFLIAADGAQSPLRHLLGIAVSEKPEGQQAIVAELRLEQAHQNIAWQHFLPTGPVAILPLADPHRASLVWSYENTDCERILALSDSAFSQALTEAFDHRLGEIHLASERLSFPLIQRLAQKFTTPYAALLGDAAHTVHPLAGLGMNLAFEGVKALSHLSLAEYERQQKLAARALQLSMTSYRALFSNPQSSLAWLRSRALDFVEKRPFLKRYLAKTTIRL